MSNIGRTLLQYWIEIRSFPGKRREECLKFIMKLLAPNKVNILFLLTLSLIERSETQLTVKRKSQKI